MAENADGSEKSEEPSEKKLREAREKGTVPRSKELTTLLMTLGAALFLLWYGAEMYDKMAKIATMGLSLDRSHAFDLNMLVNRMVGMIDLSLALIFPFIALMVVIAIISPALLGGWNFSTQAMTPKLSKMNLVSGLKRMFSKNALMELTKALAKLILVGGVAGIFLWMSFEEIIQIGKEPLHLAMAHAGTLIVEAFIFVSLSLIVVALMDVPFQMIQHINQLKMTKQEVKDEHKQQEGNPEVKGRIRQLQREMSQKRMMQAVPEADVVITNPTHFAIALKYGEGMAEPIVTALGADFMASQMRTIAKEHNIPMIEAPPLARALYYNAEVDQPIPYDLFKAVASVLAYVYQIRDGKRAESVDFENLPIPKELQVDAENKPIN